MISGILIDSANDVIYDLYYTYTRAVDTLRSGISCMKHTANSIAWFPEHIKGYPFHISDLASLQPLITRGTIDGGIA